MKALTPLLDGTGFRGALLHGVTGSGKTRVYLELAKQCLERGQNVLILVPEIALTPQTRDRFQRHLHEEVLLLHSNLPAPERRRSWTQLLQGKARVVMGTRSAILAAGLNPSLIIIDEEHDSSYKQQDPAPRYHCRELAFHLAHRNGALVVLGSATPSLESWEYAQRGHLLLVQLKERARPLPLPKVRIVDLRKEAKQDRELTMSPALREALSDTLLQGHQAIVLHNRRGYATSRVCMKCGDVIECQSCQVPLILHRQHNALLCHYCGRLYPVRTPCPKCHVIDFQFEGSAIEKVEQEILAWIPGAKIIRMDRDTVQNIGAAEKILSDFRDGTYNILLGTQMVAKGHDFPNVQLVGVISADIGAALPDFRSGERSFQLLTQVGGRAGRAYEGGRVILQSWNPTDAVFQFAMRHDYEGFARWELANRKELQYPPYGRLLAIEVTGKEIDRVDALCTLIHSCLQIIPGITILGPADAYVAMIRGQHRKQFLLKGPTPQLLRHAALKVQGILSAQPSNGVIVKFDMDPMGML
jgi:primosomal protein N' (replication factor Y)